MSSAHCMPTLIGASNKTEPDLSWPHVTPLTPYADFAFIWNLRFLAPLPCFFLVLLWMLHKFSEHVAALQEAHPGTQGPSLLWTPMTLISQDGIHLMSAVSYGPGCFMGFPFLLMAGTLSLSIVSNGHHPPSWYILCIYIYIYIYTYTHRHLN